MANYNDYRRAERYIQFKKQEFNNLFDRLIQYPVQRIPKRYAQDLGRNKVIRCLNCNRNNKLININEGIISLNPRVNLEKVGKGFKIKIF